MPESTLHTERGDVQLLPVEMALYRALARDRFRVWTREELCRELDLTGRQVDSAAVRLRHQIRAQAGLRLVVNVWGVGYRLEDRQ